MGDEEGRTSWSENSCRGKTWVWRRLMTQGSTTWLETCVTKKDPWLLMRVQTEDGWFLEDCSPTQPGTAASPKEIRGSNWICMVWMPVSLKFMSWDGIQEVEHWRLGHDEIRGQSSTAPSHPVTQKGPHLTLLVPGSQISASRTVRNFTGFRNHTVLGIFF